MKAETYGVIKTRVSMAEYFCSEVQRDLEGMPKSQHCTVWLLEHVVIARDNLLEAERILRDYRERMLKSGESS